jgi:ADP-heptose:LPS heptosyltransferase
MIEPKNLLIVRTDRIGDVVLSLPLAGIVKKHFPDCRVTFLVRNYTKSLTTGHPFIDEVIELEENQRGILLYENIVRIMNYKFDSVVVVYPTFITTIIIFLSGIHKRIGTGYRWYSALFNYKSFEHRKFAEKHELEYNVNLLKFFGIEEKINPGNVIFNLPVDKASDERVKTILKVKQINLNKPVIMVHPGSGGSAVDLPLNTLKELIINVAGSLDAEIIITGSKQEMELCHQLQVPGKTRNLSGLFDLPELTALINYSDIFIANSTGPLHIAAALGKYVIGFYPKIAACSPRRWGPYSEKGNVFIPNINCSNCTREQCIQLNCMSSIKSEDIFVVIEKIYKLIIK